MRAGRVIGSVVAVRVTEGLEGNKFLVVLPVGEDDRPEGEAFVACDVVNAGPGSRVIWIGGKEAAFALGEGDIPVDATCVAILEKHDGERPEE